MEITKEIKLCNAITERFLKIGKASSAGDIAEWLNMSESTVYKWLRDCGSRNGQGPAGCTMHYRDRTLRGSKDTYSPGRSHLREIILKLRLPPPF